MFIKFKSAPELGRLRVVNARLRKYTEVASCIQCVLFRDKYFELCKKTPCCLGEGEFVHFVKEPSNGENVEESNRNGRD